MPGRETDRLRNISQRDRLMVPGLDQVEDRREQRLNAQLAGNVEVEATKAHEQQRQVGAASA
jgi:hypothetical protein